MGTPNPPPRKFAEKIAILEAKEREQKAKFTNILHEVQEAHNISHGSTSMRSQQYLRAATQDTGHLLPHHHAAPGDLHRTGFAHTSMPNLHQTPPNHLPASPYLQQQQQAGTYFGFPYMDSQPVYHDGQQYPLPADAAQAQMAMRQSRHSQPSSISGLPSAYGILPTSVQGRHAQASMPQSAGQRHHSLETGMGGGYANHVATSVSAGMRSGGMNLSRTISNSDSELCREIGSVPPPLQPMHNINAGHSNQSRDAHGRLSTTNSTQASPHQAQRQSSGDGIPPLAPGLESASSRGQSMAGVSRTLLSSNSNSLPNLHEQQQQQHQPSTFPYTHPLPAFDEVPGQASGGGSTCAVSAANAAALAASAGFASSGRELSSEMNGGGQVMAHGLSAGNSRSLTNIQARRPSAGGPPASTSGVGPMKLRRSTSTLSRNKPYAQVSTASVPDLGRGEFIGASAQQQIAPSSLVNTLPAYTMSPVASNANMSSLHQVTGGSGTSAITATGAISSLPPDLAVAAALSERSQQFFGGPRTADQDLMASSDQHLQQMWLSQTPSSGLDGSTQQLQSAGPSTGHLPALLADMSVHSLQNVHGSHGDFPSMIQSPPQNAGQLPFPYAGMPAGDGHVHENGIIGHGGFTASSATPGATVSSHNLLTRRSSHGGGGSGTPPPLLVRAGSQGSLPPGLQSNAAHTQAATAGSYLPGGERPVHSSPLPQQRAMALKAAAAAASLARSPGLSATETTSTQLMPTASILPVASVAATSGGVAGGNAVLSSIYGVDSTLVM